MPPLKGVELEVTDGITEHSSRVALKGVFSNFGDVVACWVPPIDRRGIDNASVRFSAAQSAEAAKIACDAGQVFLQGMQLKVIWRSGGGRRVGNSDLGSEAGNEVGSMALRDIPDSKRKADGRKRSRSRRRRSNSRRRYRSRSRSKNVSRADRAAASRSRDRNDASVPPPGVSIAPPALPADPNGLPDWLTGVEQPMDQLASMPQSMPPSMPYETQLGLGGMMTPQHGLGALATQTPAAESFPIIDPAERERRRQETEAIKRERQAQMKRGPGVAALVQAALKKAQTTDSISKKEEPRPLPQIVQQRPEEVEDSDESEENDEKRTKRVELELQHKLLQDEEAKLSREREQQVAQERERAEQEARERRERARKEAAEAERILQQREAETREQRIKASVEAAKRQQAERAAAKAAKEAADNLYSDMPQPDTELEKKQNEERKKEAEQRQKQMQFTNLPPEDKSKVVFLDVDGVLRPARAGGFDTLSDDNARVDTSDFFPSAVKALRHIIERTGASIVLSSEWRRNDALRNALSETFEKNRLRPWSSTTPTNLELEPGPDPVRQFADRRAREIGAWLQENEATGWVVLDDINIAIVDEAKKTQSKKDAIGPHLVQTWPLCGLTMGNAKTVVRILNGEMINKVVVERPVAPAPSGLSTPMPGKASGLATPMPGARK